MKEVVATGEAAIRRKARPWEIFPHHFFTEPEEARTLFARLVGATADDIAIQPSTSYGAAIAAATLELPRGARIVVLQEQFPSNVYPWREAARRGGAVLETVPRPADDDWTPAVLERLVAGTALVALPHVHWTDGAMLDLVTIGKRAREIGAALFIDATQSLGVLPLDVREVQPDYLVAATYKWLLGPYGMGFLYVAPHRQSGRPIEEHWRGQPQPLRGHSTARCGAQHRHLFLSRARSAGASADCPGHRQRGGDGEQLSAGATLRLRLALRG
jgi:selenocysteine lyase/cysteine desulfurase